MSLFKSRSVTLFVLCDGVIASVRGLLPYTSGSGLSWESLALAVLRASDCLTSTTGDGLSPIFLCCPLKSTGMGRQIENIGSNSVI